MARRGFLKPLAVCAPLPENRGSTVEDLPNMSRFLFPPLTIALVLLAEIVPLSSVCAASSDPAVPASGRPVGSPEGMVWIKGGEFSMGASESSTAMYSGKGQPFLDAQPVHRVQVDGFWMDQTEVTNAEFARFVAATGYLTVAERPPRAQDFPDVPKSQLAAGSLVFAPPSQAVSLRDYQRWWRYQLGANWRHPEGPGSSIDGRENYPVVQMAYPDAVAFASWAGKRLPTEAEWEFAARGGLSGKLYPWGNDFQPNGKWMANTYQGHFPDHDIAADGYAGIAPVKSYPPNGYGLYDMSGNVWEWCRDWYRANYYRTLASKGVAHNPQGPDVSFDSEEPGAKKRVQRGGSFLCTDQYCTRYMIGTRGKGEINTSSNHLGFRCVRD